MLSSLSAYSFFLQEPPAKNGRLLLHIEKDRRSDSYHTKRLEIPQRGHLLCRHGAAHRLRAGRHPPCGGSAKRCGKPLCAHPYRGDGDFPHRKKRYQPTHVLIAHNTAFEKPSVVQLEQIFTIDKSRIQRFLGRITQNEMQEIEKGVVSSLALAEITS